ncbi:helix-turn-helix domain-containing protein [Nocardia sp. NPDC052566]|uniref:helix-turn-helix domain-containing protein n=1 Tax=Nocardia sp. NPDC052566 TaxID=3364330 RepID=UPI0037C72E36
MTGVDEARENLGARLRELRRDAGLDGRQLAALAGWRPPKVSKIEHGRQTPSENDIRVWCAHTKSELQIPDLIASVRNINAAYLEWKRVVASGHKRRQQQSVSLEAHIELIRGYDPDVFQGLLQTPDYAAAVLRASVDLYQVPDDIQAAVVVRMERQQVLRTGIHRIHFIVDERVLTTTVGNDQIMIGQLQHVLELMDLPRLVFGVVPRYAEYRVPATNFLMYDRRLVQVETVTAELTITQPREIILYEKTFQVLSSQAEYGEAAWALIRTALDRRRDLGRG